ncbi:MAG TPA: type VI secretion system tip protein TssI/VgrG [Chthoniobacteraceae bacterium]|jgi:type VI secretion system secreted protein VgrG|nr:type VI secretion system tip protein TssI/VgrG [Chthoniobacteraceae bacterium]
MSEPTQKYRFASIQTPLGEDRLLLRYMSGREELGCLFDYNLTLLDAHQDVNPDDLVGLNVTVRIQLETDEEDHARYINGFITSLAFLGYQDGAGFYHARLVPWLWLLTRTSDCRSFQDRTVRQILEEVFSDYGFKDFRFDLTQEYLPKVFCVQYNETAFNFVSRIMEHEGMYYWWEHVNGNHTMVITDSVTTHPVNPLRAEIEWRPRTGVLFDGFLYSLRLQKTVSPGGFHLNDYNFKKPKEDLRTERKKPKAHAAKDFEHFEYPGIYRETAPGEQLSNVRLEEAQTNHETIDAEVTARAMASGYKFSLTRAERQDQERKYLIIASSISVTLDPYAATGQGGGDHFEGRITALPDGVPFRRARTTPKPIISGPQPGLVVGPPGEEIYTDDHGRVKVHFYWDRRSEANEKSSKWVRVSQASAGGEYGFMSLPRVGQEVLVVFMNGDPDQPIVTGRVYNGEYKYPYDPVAHKSRSSWKTNTTPGGGGFNELRFEDKKGKEQIFVHGQKDMDTRLLEKNREWVGKSKHLITIEDSLEKVGRDKHETTTRHFTEEVKENHYETIGGDSLTKVGGAFQVEVDGSIRVVAHGDATHLTDGNLAVLTGGNVLIQANSITLQAGGNFVKVDPSGVTIVGTIVLINSGGSPGQVNPVAEKRLDVPKAPEVADDAGEGKVEDTKGMGFKAKAQDFPDQTVSDISAKEGKPFMEEPAPAQLRSALDPLEAAGLASGLKDMTTPVQEGADEVRDLLREATGLVKDAADDLTGAIKDAADLAKGLVQDVTAPIKEAADALHEAVQEVQTSVKEAEAAVKEARDSVKEALKDAAKEVTEPLKEAVQAVHETADEVKSTAQEVKQLAATAKAAVQEAKASAKEALSGALQEAAAPVKEAAGAIKGAASEIKGAASAVQSEAQDALKEAAGQVSGAKSMVKDAGKAIRQATGSLQKSLGGLGDLLS